MAKTLFRKRIERTYIFLMLPAVIFVLVLFGIPTIYGGGYLSLRDFNLLAGTNRFIGVKNYAMTILDKQFGMALLRTMIYVIVVVSVDFVYAFCAALLVYTIKGVFAKILRGIIMLPILLIPVSSAVVWRSVIYNPPYEALNQLLGLKTLILGNPSTAFWGIIIAVIWAWAPWMFILLFAGLEGLPLEPIEASRLDGANYLQTVWYIILPMLKPIIFIVVILKAIGSFQSFDFPWVMTEGGPAGSSHLISTYIFYVAFRQLNYGYGSAMTIFALAIPFLLTYLVLKCFRGDYTK